MNAPLAPSERDGIIQSFLIGTGRRPFETPAALSGARPDAAILAALATVALERRFMRAFPVGSGTRELFTPRPDGAAPGAALPTDDRPPMPPRTRKALGTLAGFLRKSESRLLVGAALDMAEGLGWRIHPFDYPALRDVLISRQDSLGPAERAYLRATGHRTHDGGAEIGEDDWEVAKPQERLRLLERMRAADPDAAREFLAVRINDVKPEHRESLVEALLIGFSDRDRPFVEQIIQKDRSEHVRRKAKYLLARVPASSERLEVVRDTAGLFELGKSLIPWRKRSLSMRRSHAHHAFERATNARVTVDEIAGALGMARREMLEIVPADDREVIRALLEIAAASLDAEAFSHVAMANGELNWATVLGIADGAGFPLPGRRQIVRSLHGFGDAIRPPEEWAALRTFNGGPLARWQADAIIGSKSLRGFVDTHSRTSNDYQRKSGWAHVEALAGLIPPAAATAFRNAVAGYYPGVPTTVGHYLDFVEAADRDAKDSGIVPHYEE